MDVDAKNDANSLDAGSSWVDSYRHPALRTLVLEPENLSGFLGLHSLDGHNLGGHSRGGFVGMAHHPRNANTHREVSSDTVTQLLTIRST